MSCRQAAALSGCLLIVGCTVTVALTGADVDSGMYQQALSINKWLTAFFNNPIRLARARRQHVCSSKARF